MLEPENGKRIYESARYVQISFKLVLHMLFGNCRCSCQFHSMLCFYNSTCTNHVLAYVCVERNCRFDDIYRLRVCCVCHRIIHVINVNGKHFEKIQLSRRRLDLSFGKHTYSASILVFFSDVSELEPNFFSSASFRGQKVIFTYAYRMDGCVGLHSHPTALFVVNIFMIFIYHSFRPQK